MIVYVVLIDTAGEEEFETIFSTKGLAENYKRQLVIAKGYLGLIDPEENIKIVEWRIDDWGQIGKLLNKTGG